MVDAGAVFWITKATDANRTTGAQFEDERFDEYCQAVDKRLLTGCYHWLQNSLPARNAADFYLQRYRRYQFDFVPIMDFEEKRVLELGQQAAYAQKGREWCEYVKLTTGLTPIIYTANWYTTQFAKHLIEWMKDYPLWVADYTAESNQTGKPIIPYPWQSWKMWQFSADKNKRGAEFGLSSEDVCLDYYNGTMNELQEFTGGNVSKPLTRLYYPCDPKYRLTQVFGANPSWYPNSRGHNGIDFGTPVGAPIFAAADGVVEVATALTYGYGRHVRIRHSHGVTIYGHLSRIDVKVGDKIKAMDLVGLSGGAKSDPYAGMSTGPHLHFEYRWEYPPTPLVPGSYAYNAVDPLPLLVLHELPEPDQDADYYHIVIKGNLTIRALPAFPEGQILGHIVLGDLPYKSYEKAKDKNGRDWFKIERNGVIGWIAGYTQWTEITKIYAPEPPTTDPDPDPEPPILTLEQRVERIEQHLGI